MCGLALPARAQDDDDDDATDSAVMRFCRAVLGRHMSDRYVPRRFFVYDADRMKRQITPLLLVLVVIELTDLVRAAQPGPHGGVRAGEAALASTSACPPAATQVFAVDSIPACLGVTTDPLILWSSNMLAILGLRSVFSLLAEATLYTAALAKPVALVLAFISMKIMLEFGGVEVGTRARAAHGPSPA